MNKFVIVLIIASFSGCGGLFTQADYTQITKFTNMSSNLSESEERIDNSITKEFFVILSSKEKKLKIEIKTGQLESSEIGELRPFYIFEKYNPLETELTEFKSYTKIGANHDSDWSLSEFVEITPSENDPLGTLNSGIYRVRITVFDSADFSFECLFYSNGEPLLFALTFNDAKRKYAQTLLEQNRE
jgi:hypothetical protein